MKPRSSFGKPFKFFVGGPKYFVGGPKHFVGGTEKHYLSNLEKVSAKTFAVVSKCGRYEDYLGGPKTYSHKLAVQLLRKEHQR